MLIACMGMGMIAGCGDSGEDQTSEISAGTEETEVTKVAATTGTTNKTDLIVGVGAQPSSWNILESADVTSISIEDLIYDRCFVVEDGEVGANIIESYEYTGDDGLDLVLHVKEGAYFSNGDPLTADDVLYTIERLCSNFVWGNRMGSVDIENSYVEDENTVVLRLFQYDNITLSTLTAEASYILDKELVEANGGEDFISTADALVGTGPYKVVSIENDVSITLERNEYYWGEPGAFDTITIKFFTDESTRALELQNGNLDVAYITSGETVKSLSSGSADNVNLYSWPITKYGLFCMSTVVDTDTIFQNEDLRKAVAYAIDIDAIVENVCSGTGTAVHSTLSEGVMGYKDETIEYDPEKAKEYLEAAGYSDGFEFTTMIAADQYQDLSVAEAIQAYLSAVGITMNIESADLPTIMGAQLGYQQVSGIMTTALRADPIEVYTTYFTGSGNCLGENHDESLNEMLNENRYESDQDAREAQLEAIQDYVKEHMYTIPLYQTTGSWAYQNYVNGVENAAQSEEACLWLGQLSFNN